MNAYVALFRGINVGGKNLLQMGKLKQLLSEAGFSQVSTYIQSGNVLFKSEETDIDKIVDNIRISVFSEFGFEPEVLVLQPEEIEQAILGNPYGESVSKPESLHVGFLSEAPSNPDLQKLESIKKDSERFSLVGKYFYLSAPEGVGRSKLAAQSERLLGVTMTDRNWRTVIKIQDMLANVAVQTP